MRRGESFEEYNSNSGKGSELSRSATTGRNASPVTRKKGFLGSLRHTKKKNRSIEHIKGQGSLAEEPAFQQWEDQKEGDTERIKILNLVKEGKLSIEEAMQHAEELGVTGSGYSDEMAADAEEKIFNYGIYKYNRNRTSCSRRILQFDFQEKVLCTIQKGSRGKKFEFSQIRGFDSEDGVRFFIYIEEHHDYELDADTVEEKNKICTLLESIVQQNKADEPDGEFEMPVFGVEQAIKEGQVEKKGHSAAFMMWPRRWLRVQQGELAYYKIGEENQTALNIIKLGPGLADVKKVDQGGFIVTTSKKEYSFRVMNVNITKDPQAVERERDEWIEAISEGSQTSRRSRAGSFVQDPAFNSTVQEQEKYVKDIVKTLLRELEQLTSILTVVNAPIQATVQVKKVQEVVCNMETQARTGVLSWAMRGELKSRSPSAKNVSPSPTPPSTLPRQQSTTRQKPSHPELITTPIDEGYEMVIPPTRPPKGGSESEYNSAPPRRTPPPTPPRDTRLPSPTISSSTYDPSQHSPLISSPKCPLSSSVGTSFPGIVTLTPPKGPVTPYDTVSITPTSRSPVSSSPGASPERQDKPRGSPPGGELYQHPSPRGIRQQRDNRGDVYDNVNIKNLPVMAGQPTPTPNMGRAGDSTVPYTTGDGIQAVTPSGGVRSSPEGTPVKGDALEEVDAAKQRMEGAKEVPGGTEIDAGGMGCGSLEDAVKERKELYTERQEGNVVLLSVKTSDNDMTEEPESPTLESSKLPNGVPVAPPPPPPGGIPPPPPPMGGGSMALDAGLPCKDKFKSKKKLRPFFWNKVPVNMVPKSLWLSAQDRSDNLDFSLLEDMFEMEERDKPVLQAAAKPTAKMLLDPKKAHNLGIFLSGFKLTAKEIDSKLSVFREEEGALPVDHVIALKRFLPTPDEQEMYKNIKLEDIPGLLAEDKFMIKLCEITDLDKRLDLLLVIMEFPSQYEDLAPAVTSLLDACHELYCSKKFLVVLEYILSIGNYINGGTNRGGAYGIRLTTLPKLADIRGKNKKDTLLRYLVMQLQHSSPDTLGVMQELKAVPKAADASIKGLSAEVEVMRKDLSKIKKHSNDLFLKQRRTDQQDVKFFRDVDAFVLEYEEKLKDLCDKCKEMKYIYSKLLSRFGEAPNTDSEELLTSISVFLTQFKKTLNEAESGPRDTKRIKLEGLREAVSARATRLTSQDSTTTSPGSPRSSAEDTVDPGTTESDGQGEQITNNAINSTEEETRKALPELKPPTPVNTTSSPKVIHKKLSVKAPSTKVAPQSTQRPTRQGYLDKLSGGKRKAPKWDTRYFELTEGGHLHYYKKPDSKIINTIYLRGCPVEIDAEEPTVIVIKTEDREWCLRAVDSEEARAWKEMLGFYIEKSI